MQAFTVGEPAHVGKNTVGGRLRLQHMIQGHPDLGWRSRYNAAGTEELPHPNVTVESPS